MENKSTSPNWLPQIEAPYHYMFKELKNEGIGVTNDSIDINELNPSQPFIETDKVSSIYNSISNGEQSVKPVWVSNDNKIIDGHHNYFASKANGDDKILTIKIDADFNSAVRILNKIMDIYNFNNDNNKNSQEHELYSDASIDENGEISDKIGVFRFKKMTENDKKYKVSFDHLLELKSDIIGDDPTKYEYNTCMYFEPNKNYQKLAMDENVSVEEYCKKYLGELLKKRGYDGVNYNNEIVKSI